MKKRRVFPGLLFFAAAVGLLLALAPGGRAQTVSGQAIVNSSWKNTLSRPGDGTGRGSVYVGVWAGSNLVTGLPSWTNRLAGPASLPLLMGSAFPYVLGPLTNPGPYRAMAWIDGNTNPTYERGEPRSPDVSFTITTNRSRNVIGVNLTIVDDYDADGMPDWWEVHWFGSLAQSGSDDWDKDGLSNVIEYQIATTVTNLATLSPVDWDTDGDGMDDRWEYEYWAEGHGLNPVVADAYGDVDGDGLANVQEYRGIDGLPPLEQDPAATNRVARRVSGSDDGIDPTDLDTDGDGLLDSFEAAWYDPASGIDPRLAGSAAADPDGDGLSNFREQCLHAWLREGGATDLWTFGPESLPAADAYGIRALVPKLALGATNRVAIQAELAVLRAHAWTDPTPGTGYAESLTPGHDTDGDELPDGWEVEFRLDPRSGVGANGFWGDPDGDGLVNYQEYLGQDGERSGTGPLLNGTGDETNPNEHDWRPRSTGPGAGVRRPALPVGWWYAYRVSPGNGTLGGAAPTRSLGRDRGRDTDDDGIDDDVEIHLEYPAGSGRIGTSPVHSMHPFAKRAARLTSVAGIQIPDPEGNAMAGYSPLLHTRDWTLECYVKVLTNHASGYLINCLGPTNLPRHISYRLELTNNVPRVLFQTLGGWTNAVSGAALPTNQWVHLAAVWDHLDNSLSLHVDGIFVQERRFFEEALSGIDFPLAAPATIGESPDGSFVNRVLVDEVRIWGHARAAAEIERYRGRLVPPGTGGLLAYFRFDDGGKSAEDFTRKAKNGLLGAASQDYPFGDFGYALTNGFAFTTNDYAQVRGVDEEGADDSDGDGMPDGWEMINGLDPNSAVGLSGAQGDPDGDGLHNLYEYWTDMNPRAEDTNEDALPDAYEDLDGDGVANLTEQDQGSRPDMADTDDDGYTDGEEWEAATDPTDPLSPGGSRALKSGGAAQDYLDFPISASQRLKDWTIEAWVKPHAAGAAGQGFILRRAVKALGGGAYAMNYMLGLTNGASGSWPYAGYVLPDGTARFLISSNGIAPGAWTYLGATYDSDTARMTLYTNGVKAVSASGFVRIPPVNGHGGETFVRAGEGFKGLVDELRLWNLARTPAQIRATFETTVDPRTAVGLVHDYGMNDTQARTNAVGFGRYHRPRGAQDFTHPRDWTNDWVHAATLHGDVDFTDAGQGAVSELRVVLEPREAREAGMRWRVDGRAWRQSGEREHEFTSGVHRVEFTALPHWTTVTNREVTIRIGDSLVVTNGYRRNGNLTVVLEPQAVTNAARWQMDGGASAYVSGHTVSNVAPANHTMTFRDVPGWVTPAAATVGVPENGTTVWTGRYAMAFGWIRAELSPPEVVAEGARWRVVGGPWLAGGVATNVQADRAYAVEFRPVAPWVTPGSQTVQVVRGQTNAVQGVYRLLTVSGVVFNASAWRNDAHLTPPGDGTDGGQLVVGVWSNGAVRSGAPVKRQMLAATNALPLASGPRGFSISRLMAGTYVVGAWVDGNTNGLYEMGEPAATARVFTVATTGVVMNLTVVDDLDTDRMPDWWEAHWFGNLDRTGGADSDGDGLTDLKEYQVSTQTLAYTICPTNWDTDADGMDDKWEVDRLAGGRGLNAVVADGVLDADGDGLSNAQEYRGLDGQGPLEAAPGAPALGRTNRWDSGDALDPLDADMDGDGLLDSFEAAWHDPERGIDARVPGSVGADEDEDGLTVYREQCLLSALGEGGANDLWTGGPGSVPARADGMRVLVPPLLLGATNSATITNALAQLRRPATQTRAWTDPTSGTGYNETLAAGHDTDGDGLPDGWEVEFGLDPQDSSGTNGVNGDPDQDGLWNIDEYRGQDGRRSSTRPYIDGTGDETNPMQHNGCPAGTVAGAGTQRGNTLGSARPTLSVGSQDGRDTDDDGLPDGVEIQQRATSPLHSMHPFVRRSARIFNAAGIAVPDPDAASTGRYRPDLIGRAWTVECYVRVTAANGNAYLVDSVGSTNATERIVYRLAVTNGEPEISFDTLAGARYAVRGQSLPTNQWVHLAGVWDPDRNALSLYMDGVSLNRTQVVQEAYSAVGSATNGGPRLGVLLDPALLGRVYLDEVRIWLEARTTEQIEWYRRRLAPTTARNLAAYYRFDDGGGSAEDFTRRACNGLLGSAPQRYEFGDFAYALATNNAFAFASNTFADVVGMDDGAADDTDNDGLPDGWELVHQFNPRSPVGAGEGEADADRDRLRNRYEYWAQTNPNAADGDGDKDTDGDFLVNREEQESGTRPDMADTDDDGVVDGEERRAGTNPLGADDPRVWRAVFLDGSPRSYVEIPNVLDQRLSSWTLEAWVNPTNIAAGDGVVVRRRVRDIGAGQVAMNYVMGLQAVGGSLQPYAGYVTIEGSTNFVSGGVATPGIWTHLAATYDGRTFGLSLYTNGIRIAQGNRLAGAPPLNGRASETFLRIGEDFQGQIDEVRIWRIARPGGEILAEFKQRIEDVASTNLVHGFAFDDGQAVSTWLPFSGYHQSQGAEDFTHPRDWTNQWSHAAKLVGGVTFTNECAKVGPTVSGEVVNQSTWPNRPSVLAPPGDGRGSGRLIVGAWTNGPSLSGRPAFSVVLVASSALPWPQMTANFLIGPLKVGRTYTVAAWIDGDGNGRYDVGEPRSGVWQGLASNRHVSGVGLTVVDDFDADGLVDWWEAHWFDTLGVTPDGDEDGDGLHNLYEYRIGLDPKRKDSDSDGVFDYDEDSDGDALSNGDELTLFGTKIDDPDTDDDGFSDGDEVNSLVFCPRSGLNRRRLTSPLYSRSPLIQRSLVLGGGALLLTDPVIPGNPERFDLSEWTIECWIMLPSNAVQTGSLVARVTQAGRTNFCLRLTNNVPLIQFTTQAGTAYTAGSPAPLPAAVWSHVAGVFNPAAHTLALYVNGVAYQALTTVERCARGSGATKVGEKLRGHMDKLAIWSTARSVEDLNRDMHQFGFTGQAANTAPAVYGGVFFPLGAASFADEFADYRDGSDANAHTRPSSATGVPDAAADSGYLSLGSNGWVVLKFIDNLLAPDGSPAVDLYVFEADPDSEGVKVEISEDGVNWLQAGRIAGGSGGLDIDRIASPDQRFVYVRLTDTGSNTYAQVASPGADLDAVGAVSSVLVSGLLAWFPFDDSENTTVVNLLTGVARGQGAEDYANPLNWSYALRGVAFSSNVGEYVDLAGVADSDGDKIPDWWEAFYFKGKADPDRDEDRDGLNNLFEYYCDTNPRDDDTDNDGVLDGAEDFDEDGLENQDEQTHHSDPRLRDTDDDGIPDLAEKHRGFDPVDPLVPLHWRAAALPGTAGSYIELPADPRFGLVDWTIEAWVRPAAGWTNGGTILFREIQPGVTNFFLGLDSKLQPVAGFGTDAITIVTVPKPVTVDGTSWTHLAATYRRDGQRLRIYVNGILRAERLCPYNPRPSGFGPIVQRIGERFKGLIDEVRIWSAERSDTSINLNQDIPQTGAETNLVAYYRFDDGTAWTNRLTGTSLVPEWQTGQIQDFLRIYKDDWLTAWRHAATLRGGVTLSADNPMEEDYDGDGMPDAWEVANGLDPRNANDADADLDGDGLLNRDEYATQLDPAKTDSDADGIADPAEDSDGDGLVNIEEVTLYKTDPGDPDTDDDGFSDGKEVNTSVSCGSHRLIGPLYPRSPVILASSPLYSRDPAVPRSLVLTGKPITVPEPRIWRVETRTRETRFASLDRWIVGCSVLIPTNQTASIMKRITEQEQEQTNFELFLSNNVPGLRFSTAGGVVHSVSSPVGAIPANRWVSLMGRWLPASDPFIPASDRLSLYVDSILVTTRVVIATCATGPGKTTVGDGFTGHLDDLYIGDRLPGEPGNIPDFVQVLDVSESMNQGLSQGLIPPIDALRRAVRFSIDAMPDGAEMAIISFHGSVTLEQDFTPDRPLLRRAIDNLSPTNGTVFAPALLKLRELYDTRVSGRKKRAILVSDGGQTNQSLPQAAIDALVDAKITVYTIGYGAVPDTQTLTQIANDTGGAFLLAPRPADLRTIMEGLVEADAPVAAFYPFDDGQNTNDIPIRRIVGRPGAEDFFRPREWEYALPDVMLDATNFSTQLTLFNLAFADPDDALPEWWIKYFFHAGEPSLADDPDHDGLTNLDEYLLGLHPLDPDTDADLTRDGNEDADGDGVSNEDEVQRYASNPMDPDTDDDGFSDGDEISSTIWCGDGLNRRRLTSPVYSRSPLVQRSLVLDGVPIELPKGPAGATFDRFDLRSWTLECWIRPTNSTPSGVLIERVLQNGCRNFCLGLSNNVPYVTFSTQTGARRYKVGGNAPIPINEWTHLAAVLDPARNTLRLLVNGLAYQAQHNVEPCAWRKVGTTTLGRDIRGFMDAVRIWSVPQPAAEIARIYDQFAAFTHQREESEILTFDGIDFFDGTNAFAATVKKHVSGDESADGNLFSDPSAVLGVPDDKVLSLGHSDLGVVGNEARFSRGYVQIELSAEVPLRGSGDARPDLYIFERRGRKEPVYVLASTDGDSWEYVGRAGGGVSGLDIDFAPRNPLIENPANLLPPFRFVIGEPDDAAAPNTNEYHYVWIIDAGDQSPFSSLGMPGADIDAIGVKTYGMGDDIVAWYPFDDSKNTTATNLLTGRVTGHGSEDYANRLDWDYALTNVTVTTSEAAPIVGDLEEHFINRIPDWWERFYFRGRANATNDVDADGLDNLHEYYCDTNPKDADTDNDGVLDGAEDFDSDGLENQDEQTHGSDPSLPDTDDDGFSDLFEKQSGYSLTNSLSPYRGRALVCTGATECYVELPSDTRFGLTDWTLEAWIQPANRWGGGGTVLRRTVAPGRTNYVLGVDGKLHPFAGFGGNNRLAMTNAITADGSTWTHLAATYRSAGQVLSLYVNGELAANRICSANPPFSGVGPIEQRIGEKFSGLIDEVRLWNSVRSPDELRAEMGFTLSGTQSNLVAYYRFDDGTSYTNGVRGAWTSGGTNWVTGQVEDFAFPDPRNWLSDWQDAATLRGAAVFSAEGQGAVPGIRVVIEPSAARVAGARWRLDGGAWTNSTETVPVRAYTNHQVEFLGTTSWVAPTSQWVRAEIGRTHVVTGRFTSIGITGVVMHASEWANTNPPPADGSGAGRVVVGVWSNGQQLAEAPFRAQIIAQIAVLPFGPQTNAFALPILPAGRHRAVAWIDGNGDSRLQLGEPRSPERWLLLLTGGVHSVELTITDDLDADELPDWWEAHWFDTTGATPYGDEDGDGLRNLFEYRLNLIPTRRDSDGNGRSDYNEDGDGDRLGNGEEQDLYGTRPDLTDTDDDGVWDGTELDPTKPKADGRTLTSPTYPRSPLVQRSLVLNGSAVSVPDRIPGTFYHRFDLSAWTIQCWVMPTKASQTGDLILRVTDAGRTNFALRLDANVPSVLFTTDTGARVKTGDNTNAPIAINEWTHLAGVWDPDRDSLRLYVNGVAYQAQVHLGRCAQGPGVTTLGRGIVGFMDDVAIWKTPRSAEAIAESLRRFGFVASTGSGAATTGPALGDLSAGERTRVQRELETAARAAAAAGGRYTVGYSPILARAEAQRHGLIFNPNAPPPDPRHVGLALADVRLPPALDWRLAGAVTPVKDQGLCGSCWAHVTVGAFESAILIAEGRTVDLSEQHLLSCNLDDWDCIGGLPAHKYHYDTPSADGRVGAVLESDFPYMASDLAPCGGPYSRPYVLDNWGYLGAGPSDTAIPDATIKKAIYAHGPVASAIFAGPAFDAYAGGIFNTHEQGQSGHGNHAVVIVGWNDREGYWIVKNSWGAGWGESGFMRIAYGVSGIGEGATFVVYGTPTASGELVAHYPFDDGGTTADDFVHLLEPDYALTNVVLTPNTFADLPQPVDVDGDRIPDWWEDLFLGSAMGVDAALDSDGDGLSNLYEFYCDTNPRDQDTNGNGRPDGDEDFDRDGLKNQDEQTHGSDPRLPDTDDDGIRDDVETGNGSDPADSLSPARQRGLQCPGQPDSYVRLAMDTRFALPEWTVEAWIKPANGWRGDGTVLQRSSAPDAANYFLAVDADLRPVAGFGANVLRGPAAIPANGWSWTHLAAACRPQDQTLSLYVNGTRVASRICPGTPRIGGAGPVLQRIGERFRGAIDEVRIWSVARAAADIARDLEFELLGSESNLVAYYRFDDGTSYTNGVVGAWTSSATNWIRGQVEDFAVPYRRNWLDQWQDAGTLMGTAAFTVHGEGVPLLPAMPRVSGLMVALSPRQAVTDGAEWRVDGGPWTNRTVFLDLPAGTHSLEFRALNGWVAPVTETVTLAARTPLFLRRAYYPVLGAYGDLAGEFNRPRGMACDSLGFLYVADSGNHRIQRLDPLTGEWVIFGTNGTATGQFSFPFGVAVDRMDNLYVADTGNHRVQKRDVVTGAWTNLGGTAFGAGLGQFNAPFSVAVDSALNVYVADHYNWRVQRRSAVDGSWTVFVRGGFEDGFVRYPDALAVGPGDVIYVCDHIPESNDYSRIQCFATNGVFLGKAASSDPEEGAVSRPRALAFDATRNVLYLADTGSNRVLFTTAPPSWLSFDGQGGILNGLEGLAVDSLGQVYVADTLNNRVLKLPQDDVDEDCVPDSMEVALGTNPGDPDTDGDGANDGKEVRWESDPTDPASEPGWFMCAVGGLASRWATVAIWDSVEGEWQGVKYVFSPTRVFVPNMKLDRWYWVGIYDYSAERWTFGEWFTRAGF